MSKRVSEGCGESSYKAEQAMAEYVRTFPKDNRATALARWRLGSPPEGAEAPPTESWPAVFEALKVFVAETLRLPATAVAAATNAHTKASTEANVDGSSPNEAAEQPQMSEAQRKAEAKLADRRERFKVHAEEAVWKHFEHRAVVAMPSIRLMRRAQMGQISMQQVRRWRIDVGALLPRWVGEALAGLMLVWVGVSCNEVLHLAMRAK
jgi:hypothetical protein